MRRLEGLAEFRWNRRLVERVVRCAAIDGVEARGMEFGGSGEDSFVAVVVTKLTGALLFILLLDDGDHGPFAQGGRPGSRRG